MHFPEFSDVSPARLVAFGTLRQICVVPLVVVTSSMVPAQQSIPADIAARDQMLRAQQADAAQLIQRFQREGQDRILNDFRERFVNEAWLDESAENLKSLVFLPPLPPILEQTETDSATPAYPVVLVEHAGETFFMAHGSLHFRRLLKPAVIKRIAAYRETRDQLVGQLRQELTAAKKLPAADATRALRDFATRQEPALRTLEDQAEKIRADLTFLDDGTAVLTLREKVTPEQPAALRDYFAAIHAAHFQDALSLEQRQLLLALALEALTGASTGTDAADFFMPAPARLRWPVDPEGKLAPLLTEYRTLRDQLKSELQEQVVVQPASNGNPAKPHGTLAAQQASRFDELHRLAERIREEATGLTDPSRPTPTDFPPELVRTVGEAVATKDAFQEKTKQLVVRLGREFTPHRFKLVFRDKVPVIEAQPDADQPVGKSATKHLEETNRSLKRDYQALAVRMETARQALQRYRESLGAAAPETGKLSAQLAQIYAREENERLYADYRTAVLTPGLSPAQRRLLLNAALRDLEKHRLQAAN